MSDNSTKHINEVMNAQISDAQAVLTGSEAGRALGVVNNVVYIEADAYVGKPEALLGTTFELRKVNGECPSGLNAANAVMEFMPLPVSGAITDPDSRIKEPIKRQSVMVDQKLAAQVSLLSYLSAQLDTESSFSIMVFDQATGLVDTKAASWRDGLNQWRQDNAEALADKEVCYIFAVTGFVQKYIINKKFSKFTGQVKGGGFGVNLGGQLFVSNEDYSLDIRYGLQTVILKRPDSGKGLGKGAAAAVPPSGGGGDELSREELEVLKATALTGKVNMSGITPLLPSERNR